MNTVSFVSGKSRSLDGSNAPDEVVKASDVTDPMKLARLLMRMLKALAALKRTFSPRRTDFEDLAVDATGAKLFRLPHYFGARVRWWVIDASAAPALAKDPSTDANTLVLTSTVACTVSVRVEEAG